MTCGFLNSGSPDCCGLRSNCTCWMLECTANEKAVLVLIKGVGGDIDGRGNRVTVASRILIE